MFVGFSDSEPLSLCLLPSEVHLANSPPVLVLRAFALLFFQHSRTLRRQLRTRLSTWTMQRARSIGPSTSRQEAAAQLALTLPKASTRCNFYYFLKKCTQINGFQFEHIVFFCFCTLDDVRNGDRHLRIWLSSRPVLGPSTIWAGTWGPRYIFVPANSANIRCIFKYCGVSFLEFASARCKSRSCRASV